MKTETKRGATRWLIRETFGNLFLIVLLFGFAGRWDWAPGWALSAIYIIWSLAVTTFILPKNPEMLAERARPKAGSKKWDLVILGIFGVLGLAVYIVSGLDFRFGWSQNFSPSIQIAGLVFAFIGYDIIVVWSMVANAFFVATVRIQSDRKQTVATGGPYRFVRHPGYVGTILFQLATPFMLNSAWALIPAAAAAILFVIRTALEDKTLQEELSGYKDYATEVRYRLIPGIW